MIPDTHFKTRCRFFLRLGGRTVSKSISRLVNAESTTWAAQTATPTHTRSMRDRGMTKCSAVTPNAACAKKNTSRKAAAMPLALRIVT